LLPFYWMQRTIAWYSRPAKAELGDWLEPIVAPINWFCELYDPEGKRVGDSNGRTAGAMTRFSDRIAKLFAAVAHSRFWHVCE
jgi:hypothetical protein